MVRSPGIGGYVFGAVVTAAIAAIAWFALGKDALDKATESAGDRQAQTVRDFTGVVSRLKQRLGPEGRLVTVTLRDSSAEFVTGVDGDVAHALRWTGGDGPLEAFEENAPVGDPEPFPVAKLDARAPKRIFDAISERENGDFELSIGDLQRAGTGRLVWTMRGVIGERGVAYTASPAGAGVTRYDPASPQLSVATQLTRCIQRASNDPVKVQRCVARFRP